jgi:hypothetical protein
VIGWRKTLATLPPNHIHVLIVRAKKSCLVEIKQALDFRSETTGDNLVPRVLQLFSNRL